MRDKILIIDDDETYSTYLKAVLSKNIDADILCETNPISAIEKIEKEDGFSLIVLDIKMPLLNGYEAAKKIRELHSDIPIILLTGYVIDQITDANVEGIKVSDIFEKSSDKHDNSLLINKIKIFIEKHKFCVKKKNQMEGRYKRVFDNTLVALWEEDITKIHEMVNDLLNEIGQDKFIEYLDAHPSFVERAIENIIVKHINKKAIIMFEADSEDQLKKSIKATFTENSFAIFKQLLFSIAKGLHQFESDIQYKSLKNKLIDAHIFVNIPNDPPDFGSVVFTMIDNSYLTSLEKKEKLIYDSISKSNVVILKLIPTEDYFNVNFISDSIYNLLGYTAEDFTKGIMTIKSIVHQDDYDNMALIVKENISAKSKYFTGDFRVYTKDHTIKWVKLIATPSFDCHNNLYCVQCVLTDITPEIQLHCKLVDNLNKWKMLIESTNTAYLILNEKGTIIESNAKMAELLGCEMDDLLGSNPRAIIANQDVSKYDMAIKKLILGDYVENLELNIHNSEFFNCKASWVSMNAGLMENGQKKIFCLLRDITDIKLQELKRYIGDQKQKDKFKQNVLKIRDKLQAISGSIKHDN